MQYEILQQCPLTNVILVFGCIVQSQIMTDKNGLSRQAHGGIDVGVTVTSVTDR